MRKLVRQIRQRTELKVIPEFKGKWAFLSNFWEHHIVLGDRAYATNEHAYQAFKASSEEEHDRIRFAKTPQAAKKLGQKVKLRDTWEQEKLTVMAACIDAKFPPNSEMAEMLLATGDALLMEGNWWGDTFWGVCKNRGQNWLGRLLMDHREVLKQVMKEADEGNNDTDVREEQIGEDGTDRGTCGTRSQADQEADPPV